MPRVLVVEDDPTIARLACLLLASLGWDAQTADTVAAATTTFARGPFRAAVVDLWLPDGAGVEVIRHLRQHADEDQLPIALATAHAAGTPEVVAACRAGATQVWQKPYGREELAGLVALSERTMPERSNSTSPSASS